MSATAVPAKPRGLLDAMQDIRYADGGEPPDVGLFLWGPREMHRRFTPARTLGLR
jgi:hypothetical protein